MRKSLHLQSADAELLDVVDDDGFQGLESLVEGHLLVPEPVEHRAQLASKQKLLVLATRLLLLLFLLVRAKQILCLVHYSELARWNLRIIAKNIEDNKFC